MDDITDVNDEDLDEISNFLAPDDDIKFEGLFFV
jgi:hypothetical protein